MADTETPLCARCRRPLDTSELLCICGAGTSTLAQEAIAGEKQSWFGPNGLAVLALCLIVVALPLLLSSSPAWHPNDEMQVLDFLAFRAQQGFGWLLSGGSIFLAFRAYSRAAVGSRFLPLVSVVLALLGTLLAAARVFT